MENLICPFCKQPMESDSVGFGPSDIFYICIKCGMSEWNGYFYDEEGDEIMNPIYPCRFCLNQMINYPEICGIKLGDLIL